MKKLIKKKINLLGDPSVGKTSLTLRFVKDIFGEKYLKTIGTNIYTKEIELDEAVLKIVIHDIMGEKEYTAVQKGAFQNSNGAIAVADVTDKSTLYSLVDDWLPRFHDVAGEDKPVALAVNKCDLDEINITPDMVVDELVGNFDSYVYTSAKIGLYVEQLFKDIGTRTLSTRGKREKEIENIVMEQELTSPKELVSASLALSSEMRLMPYEIREYILKTSGIDKFALEDDISESNALYFASALSNWYYNMAENADEDEYFKYRQRANIFLKLVNNYYSSKSLSP